MIVLIVVSGVGHELLTLVMSDDWLYGKSSTLSGLLNRSWRWHGSSHWAMGLLASVAESCHSH